MLVWCPLAAGLVLSGCWSGAPGCCPGALLLPSVPLASVFWPQPHQPRHRKPSFAYFSLLVAPMDAPSSQNFCTGPFGSCWSVLAPPAALPFPCPRRRFSPRSPNYSLSIALQENALRVTWLSLGPLWLDRGCSKPLWDPSPGDPSDGSFGKYVRAAFSLQGIFPAMPYARLGPWTPTLARKSG